LRLNNQNDMLLTLNKEKGALLATINKELNLASKYVLSLIPIPIKEGKVTSDWIFVPSRDLGGDAFGYNYLGKSQFAFYLLDVSGHGIGPALHSLQVLNILQNRTLPKVDFSKPDEVMTALNKIFQMENYRDMFFTMVYCVYDFSTKKLRYSSAGHPPIIMVSVDGLKLLEAQTIFIGASLKTEFYFNEIELTSPTSFYIFSDGVFELSQLDGKMYTFLEFKDLIYNEIELSGRKLDTLYKFALNMVGQEYLEDDYSILKIKIE